MNYATILSTEPTNRGLMASLRPAFATWRKHHVDAIATRRRIHLFKTFFDISGWWVYCETHLVQKQFVGPMTTMAMVIEEFFGLLQRRALTPWHLRLRWFFGVQSPEYLESPPTLSCKIRWRETSRWWLATCIVHLLWEDVFSEHMSLL